MTMFDIYYVSGGSVITIVFGHKYYSAELTLNPTDRFQCCI